MLFCACCRYHATVADTAFQVKPLSGGTRRLHCHLVSLCTIFHSSSACCAHDLTLTWLPWLQASTSASLHRWWHYCCLFVFVLRTSLPFFFLDLSHSAAHRVALVISTQRTHHGLLCIGTGWLLQAGKLRLKFNSLMVISIYINKFFSLNHVSTCGSVQTHTQNTPVLFKP